MDVSQIVQMFLKNQNVSGNPMIQNALQMAKQNDVKGLEQMARNLCQTKGVDINQIQNQIKQRFGLK